MELKANKRIVISEKSTTYSGRYRGCSGCIARIVSEYGNASIAVRLDNYSNPRSTYGYFYFDAQELEECTMSNTIKLAPGTECRIAKIRFIEGSNTNTTYDYACYDKDIAANDFVLVKPAHHNLTVAEVLEVIEHTGADITTREVVCKVDLSNYYSRIERRKRTAELINQMEERAAYLNGMALFELLACKDDKMSALFEEYKSLL